MSHLPYVLGDRRCLARAFHPWRLVVVVVAGTFIACSQPPAPAPRTSSTAIRLTGKLLEKVDGPPYSYLRLETAAGEVWAAVPVVTLDPAKPVTVLNPVAVKNYTAPQLGRRLDVVHFGTLEVPRP